MIIASKEIHEREKVKDPLKSKKSVLNMLRKKKHFALKRVDFIKDLSLNSTIFSV